MPDTTQDKLDRFYWQVHKAFLSRQDPRTGLLATGDDENTLVASVRDNVYSILAVWGLSIAYKKLDSNDMGRTYELQQSVVKCMRGILNCMMGQASKIERFKATQSPLDSLHARYNRRTGEQILQDYEWSHLQLDATSLFVLQLAQMTASGLNIIFTQDEVDFVQNLVYYIETTYHTPDFGIWERGDKLNHGHAELNASSVGMAKAALEAIDGLNLFGVNGGPTSIIHAFDDSIARHRFALHSLLPRESASKEVDAALLSVIGYPAFAVEDAALVDRTRQIIVEKLQGNYGCKRFLWDGYRTAVEDHTRIYYVASELKNFENIESEWPLFFTYLYLDALFKHDKEKIAEYGKKIEQVAVEKDDGIKYVPGLYHLPVDKVMAEKENPHSQIRVPNFTPLLWAQSLWFLGLMLEGGLIEWSEIDPRGRHLCVGRNKVPIVQIALLTENEVLQKKLEGYGIHTQVPSQIEPIEVRRSVELNTVYAMLGKNEKMKLSGRPAKSIGTLLSSHFVKIQKRTCVILPQFMNQKEFYTSFDPALLVDNIRDNIAYVNRYWRAALRPTIALMLTQQMFATQQYTDSILGLLHDLVGGDISGVSVKVGRVQELLLTGSIARYDFIVKPIQFWGSPLHGAPTLKPSFLAGIGHTRPSSRGSPNPHPRLILDLGGKAELNSSARGLNSPRRAGTSAVGAGASGPPLVVTTVNFEEEIEDNSALLSSSFKLTIAEKQELGLLSERELCWRFQETDNLYLGIEILSVLAQRHSYNMDYMLVFESSDGKGRLGDLVEELYSKAGSLGLWGVVRHAAAIYGKYPSTLGVAVTDILMLGKEVNLGRGIKTKNISRGLPDDVIHRMCVENSDDIRTGILLQEIIYYLGLFIRLNPPLFDGFLRIRANYIVIVLTAEMKRRARRVIPDEDAFENLMNLSPGELKGMVNWLLNMDDYKLHTSDFEKLAKEMVQQVDDQDSGKNIDLPWSPKSESEKWITRRMTEGSLSRVPKNFYVKVYTILEHCHGIQIGNRNLQSSIIAGMTKGEKNFALEVENLLDVVRRPGMRQITVEVLCTIADFMESRKQVWESPLNVNEIMEYVLDSVLPSMHTENLDTTQELFSFLDDVSHEEHNNNHNNHNNQQSNNNSSQLSDSSDIISGFYVLDSNDARDLKNIEKNKDKMRRRVFSTPPLEIGLYAVRAFIEYYGL